MTSHDEYFNYLQRRSRLGSIYRRTWLYPALCRRLKGKTLDLGCGIGDMLAYRPDTVGVDLNPHTVEFCKSRGADARLMSENVLPFPSSSFDSILMDNVLEHIAEPMPVLEEVRRVLKARGWFLVGVPGSKGWSSDADHKVVYREDSLVGTGEAAGFRHRETVYTPIGPSAWLDRNIRQYCIYVLFERT